MRRHFPVLVMLLWPVLACAQEAAEEKLPKLADLPLPTVEQLLNEKPVCWVVLNTDDVVIADVVVPRPHTLEQIQSQIAAKNTERSRAAPEDRQRLANEIEHLSYLYLTLPNLKETAEYKIPLQRVKNVIHHEDLMLRRIELLLEEQNVDQALELLTRLQQSWDDWPGAKALMDRMLFVDAETRLRQGEPEQALVVFGELYRRNKDYNGLSAEMGEATRRLAADAVASQDFRRAQFFLFRLQKWFANHPVFQEFDAQLTQQTRETMQLATAAVQQGHSREAAMQAELATRIWPRAGDLRAAHRVCAERYQRLHVGVLDLPGECRAYPLPSAADQRRQRLTELPLFEIDRVRDGTAYYRTRFFDEWEPLDLGREMRFTLKQFRQPYEMQSIVATPDVVTPILNRLDPQHADYDERLASLIQSVRVDSPTHFTLTFRRVPPRLEPLLAQLSLSTPSGGELTLAPLIDPGGFQLGDRQPKEWTYVRKLPEPDGLPKYHVAEIIEHRYDSPEGAVQALNRGEVSVLPDLPETITHRMSQDQEFLKRFFVLPDALPETHLLQFNPASAPLRVRELRTALACAVDSERLLKNFVLGDPLLLHGRIVTTPFLSSNPGRNVLLEPRRYDFSAALAMTLAAQRQLNGVIPPLTMIVAPGQAPQAAAQELARVWRHLGLDIQVVAAQDPAPEKWDILYRTLQMSEPLVELWPFLTFEQQARIADLRVYPDWLKQELVALDRTSDQTRAIESLQALHRHLWEEMAYVPLWEIDRFLVIRKNIQGFPQHPIHCYDEVDHWTIEAWYQTE